jgi:tripartite-type tricarboxylate transporter receptor subunit TctC
MRPLLRVFTFAILAFAAGASFAQSEYPNKPIRIVIPFTPGTLTTQTQIIVNSIQPKLKVPVLIDHRPGAAALLGASQVASSPADGYTLMYFVPAQLSNVFFKQPPFDVRKAFTPVASVYIGPLILTTNTQVPGTTIQEFIAYAKANRGKLNYANTTGATQLAMELFNRLAGIDMEKVEYKGAAEAMTGLITNDVQAFFGGAQTAIVQVKGGKVRALGVAGDLRLPGAPDIPTMAELGFPKMKSSVTTMVLAPAGVPHAVIAKLSPLIREAVNGEEMRKNLLNSGVPLSVEPEKLEKYVADEIDFWAETAKLVKYEPPI